MKWVTRKPSLGAGRCSKSMAGVCSLTVLCSFHTAYKAATPLIASYGGRPRHRQVSSSHAGRCGLQRKVLTLRIVPGVGQAAGFSRGVEGDELSVVALMAHA